MGAIPVRMPAAEGRRRAIDPRLLRRLWPYLRRHRFALVVSLLLALPVSALQVAQPALLKVAIDDFIVKHTTTGLGLTALAYLGALMGEQLLAFGQIYLLQWVGQRTMFRLQKDVHGHVLDLDQPFHDRASVGGLVTRMTSDVEALNEMFASGAVFIVSDLVLLIAIVVTMLAVETNLALVSLGFVPVLAGVSVVYGVLLRRAQRSIRKRLAALNARLDEDVHGMSVVQLFGREEDRAAAYAEANDAYFDANRRAIRYDAQLFAVVEGISATALAVVVWYGAYGVEGGALQFGVLKMFMQYILRFFVPIRDMSAKYAILQSAMAAGERIFGLLDEERTLPSPERAQSVARFQDRIAFEDVTFAYGEGPPVLRDVSFTIRRGERVAVVGATGAGKSTTAKLLTRQYDPTQGRVTLDGLDLRELSTTDLRRLVAVVPQEVVLFSASVRDNIRMGEKGLDEAQVRRAAEAVGADRFVRRLENGYDTHLTARGGRLSSGERQLITYARSLAADPDVLVLDEATSNVDPETERLLEQATARLLEGRTALVIAHRLSTVQHVDRILVFHEGRLREQGTHAELLARGGLYAALVALQMGRSN